MKLARFTATGLPQKKRQTLLFFLRLQLLLVHIYFHSCCKYRMVLSNCQKTPLLSSKDTLEGLTLINCPSNHGQTRISETTIINITPSVPKKTSFSIWKSWNIVNFCRENFYYISIESSRYEAFYESTFGHAPWREVLIPKWNNYVSPPKLMVVKGEERDRRICT